MIIYGFLAIFLMLGVNFFIRDLLLKLGRARHLFGHANVHQLKLLDAAFFRVEPYSLTGHSKGVPIVCWRPLQGVMQFCIAFSGCNGV